MWELRGEVRDGGDVVFDVIQHALMRGEENLTVNSAVEDDIEVRDVK